MTQTFEQWAESEGLDMSVDWKGELTSPVTAGALRGWEAAQSAGQKAVRYFVYDNEYGYNEFKTDAERDAAHRSAIEGYLDDGWSEEVESVVSGIVTHSTVMTNEESEPPPCAEHPDHDESGCDACEAWNSWPNHDFETCCKYEPQALIAAPLNGGERAADAPQVAVQPAHEQAARFAIDGAISYGMQGVHMPPDRDHWLAEYWEIGRKLAALSSPAKEQK